MTTKLMSKQVKARKQHQCFGCLKPINKGDTYHRYKGTFQGDLFSSAFHLRCFELASSSDSEWTSDNGATSGFLIDTLFDLGESQ
ncbi:MAG: hypothetical protein V3V10_07250 [Planctomycetota bacterium]